MPSEKSNFQKSSISEKMSLGGLLAIFHEKIFLNCLFKGLSKIFAKKMAFYCICREKVDKIYVIERISFKCIPLSEVLRRSFIGKKNLQKGL